MAMPIRTLAEKVVLRHSIDLMARRATVKMFLSHLHELWYRMENDGQLPPRPFAFTILHHTDYIPPPHQEALGLKPVPLH